MKKLALLLLGLGISVGLSAQSDMMLYNFNAIPQVHHTNPAYPQQAKWYIGLPAISGISTHYHNSGFALVDIFEKGTDINQNLAELSNNLDERSQLNLNNRVELLGVGFKTGRGFVTLGATQNIDFKMDLPYELFQILFSGNGSITNLDLNTFDLETINRTNFYLGYQHKLLQDKLTIGLKAKYIFVQQHAYIDRMNLSLRNNGNYNIKATSDILIRTSGPSAFESFEDQEIMDIALPNNTGFAFDFGAFYQINDKFDVSASVLDLGSITYTSYNRDYVSEGTFDFEGVEIDLSKDDFSNVGNATADSLEKAFNFREEDGNTYSRSLMSQAYASFNYHLTHKHSFGALFHTRIWNGEMFNDYGVNYVGRLSRTFQFTAGYSIINGTMHNVGAGFDLKLGAVQLYLMSDNVMAADYATVQTTNFRFGINLSFYGKRAKSMTKQKEKVKEQKEEAAETASLLYKF
ncbi:DUF5723 family protein [Croceimicrobium sp.]|uniref:DUF5723 family protein n=1 Tax=Croceimicrobium sp. TaxID=2828340 RepID=UPI003BAA786E